MLVIVGVLKEGDAGKFILIQFILLLLASPI